MQQLKHAVISRKGKSKRLWRKVAVLGLWLFFFGFSIRTLPLSWSRMWRSAETWGFADVQRGSVLNPPESICYSLVHKRDIKDETTLSLSDWGILSSLDQDTREIKDPSCLPDPTSLSYLGLLLDHFSLENHLFDDAQHIMKHRNWEDEEWSLSYMQLVAWSNKDSNSSYCVRLVTDCQEEPTFQTR